jgi:hypothetical protein
MARSLRDGSDNSVAFERQLDDTATVYESPPDGHAKTVPAVYHARPSFHPD